MDILKKIETDDEYAASLREIDNLWGMKLDSPEFCRLQAFVELVIQYERERWPMERPTLEEVAAFRAEQMGKCV